MKIYISGPITGYTNGNRTAFEMAEKSIRQEGNESVNPHDVCAELVASPEWLTMTENEQWNACMKLNIPALLQCDEICMLPAWTDSRGAMLEHEIAWRVGIKPTHFLWQGNPGNSSFLSKKTGGERVIK